MIGVQDGVFVTAAAAAYPAAMCEAIATLIQEVFGRPLRVGGVLDSETASRALLKPKEDEEVTSDEDEWGLPKAKLKDHLGGLRPPIFIQDMGASKEIRRLRALLSRQVAPYGQETPP